MYHPVTRGLYANEICKKVDPEQRSIGDFWRDEIVYKHDLQFHLGVNKEEWESSTVAKILNLPLLQVIKYVPQYLLGPFLTMEQRTKYLNGGNEFDTLLDFEANIVYGFAKKVSLGGERWLTN